MSLQQLETNPSTPAYCCLNHSHKFRFSRLSPEWLLSCRIASRKPAMIQSGVSTGHAVHPKARSESDAPQGVDTCVAIPTTSAQEPSNPCNFCSGSALLRGIILVAERSGTPATRIRFSLGSSVSSRHPTQTPPVAKWHASPREQRSNPRFECHLVQSLIVYLRHLMELRLG